MWKTGFATAEKQNFASTSFTNRGIYSAIIGSVGIVVPVLVAVWDDDIPALGNTNRGERDAAIRNRDASCERVQRPLGGALVKKMQSILAGGHAIELEISVLLGGVEVRTVEHDDHGAHGRVNVTENPDDARPGKANAARSPRRIQPDVEQLASIVGKCVMKDGIEVGKC